MSNVAVAISRLGSPSRHIPTQFQYIHYTACKVQKERRAAANGTWSFSTYEPHRTSVEAVPFPKIDSTPIFNIPTIIEPRSIGNCPGVKLNKKRVPSGRHQHEVRIRFKEQPDYSTERGQKQCPQ